MQNNFTVAAGAEYGGRPLFQSTLISQFLTQLLVIVNLSINTQNNRLVIIGQRLGTRVHSHNGQTLVTQNIVFDYANS
jgi:hypothetical protein